MYVYTYISTRLSVYLPWRACRGREYIQYSFYHLWPSLLLCCVMKRQSARLQGKHSTTSAPLVCTRVQACCYVAPVPTGW